MQSFRIRKPEIFSYPLTLGYLTRNTKELLHVVEGDTVWKVLRLGEPPVLLSIDNEADYLRVTPVNRKTNDCEKVVITTYIRKWFDMDTDLKVFYKQFKDDKLLGPLIKQYRGYRIIGQPDLFESLVWAVLGQQINLGFAYTLKQRFVETFGSRFEWNGKTWFAFPEAEAVARLLPQQLLAQQFSRQKAQYTIGIAREFVNGGIVHSALQKKLVLEAKTELMKIKGVGNWTANYALMKTFQFPDAFPLEDAGLHNALKNRLKLKEKPSKEKILRIFKKYKGWEAYATLYLWKSL